MENQEIHEGGQKSKRSEFIKYKKKLYFSTLSFFLLLSHSLTSLSLIYLFIYFVRGRWCMVQYNYNTNLCTINIISLVSLLSFYLFYALSQRSQPQDRSQSIILYTFFNVCLLENSFYALSHCFNGYSILKKSLILKSQSH